MTTLGWVICFFRGHVLSNERKTKTCRGDDGGFLLGLFEYDMECRPCLRCGLENWTHKGPGVRTLPDPRFEEPTP